MAGFDGMNPAPQILSTFPPQFRSLRLAEQQPEQGFSGASVIRLAGDVGDYCLRRWPLNRPPLARIIALHGLLRHVSTSGGNQVSVPVANQDGATVFAFGGRSWQLEPWMPGIADWQDHQSPIRLRNVMRCIANFHTAAVTYRCPPNATQWFFCQSTASSPAIQERSNLLQDWLDGGLVRIETSLANDPDPDFKKLATQIVSMTKHTGPHVLRQLRNARTRLVDLQPCLRDIWHDHILFTQDAVTGLIDANACRTESVAADLARLLGSLVGDDVQRFATAIDDYSTHRHLTSQERALVGVLDRSSVVLSSLTWLRRRYLESDPGPIQWDRVVQRLRTFRDRLLHMADTI